MDQFSLTSFFSFCIRFFFEVPLRLFVFVLLLRQLSWIWREKKRKPGREKKQWRQFCFSWTARRVVLLSFFVFFFFTGHSVVSSSSFSFSLLSLYHSLSAIVNSIERPFHTLTLYVFFLPGFFLFFLYLYSYLYNTE